MTSSASADRRRARPVRVRACLAACVLLLSAACAPRAGVVLLPRAEAGTADDGVAAAADASRAACTSVTSFSAEISVTGRVGPDRVRGRLLAGFADGGRARLEALAPFGQPVFILVASEGRGTLLLPRDRQVVSDVAASELLAALTGIAVDGRDLAALLSGCVVHGGSASAGRRLSAGWGAASLAGGRATAFVRAAPPSTAPRIVAAQLHSSSDPRAALSVGYERFGADGLPRRVRLERQSAGESLGLDLALSQVDTAAALEDPVFRVTVPPEFSSVPLERILRAGPLTKAQ